LVKHGQITHQFLLVRQTKFHPEPTLSNLRAVAPVKTAIAPRRGRLDRRAIIKNQQRLRLDGSYAETIVIRWAETARGLGRAVHSHDGA